MLHIAFLKAKFQAIHLKLATHISSVQGILINVG